MKELSEIIKDAFSSTLRAERARKNISQFDLSLKAGIDQKYLSYLENGKSIPSLTTLLKLSKALDISAKIFINEIEDKIY